MGTRRRFEREVRLHLRKRQVPPDEIEAAIERLKDLELVSDEDTTRAFIRDRMNFAPRGRALLRRELMSKGVPGAVVDEALEEILDVEDEARAAVEFLRRGARKWAGLSENVARRRMWSALARRGFPSSVCRTAMVQVAEESGVDPDDQAWD